MDAREMIEIGQISMISIQGEDGGWRLRKGRRAAEEEARAGEDTGGQGV